ncbi:velvet factor [Syncephalastrum racemosum]|uniref:Velvet factor n=1 Tax=Syncephalastrum racemosum TaxID=13706 RepID=A0A1X2H1R4_SYNRA|nr:velvet factor [Syncephalastrum racemosum]
MFVVQCGLISEGQTEQRDLVYNPASRPQQSTSRTLHPQTQHQHQQRHQQSIMSFQEPAPPVRNLTGTLAVNAHQLLDEHDQPGVFFIFQDLSVRIEGTYRLRFLFIDLSAGEPLTMSARVLHEAVSDPFTVFTAKTFPGMTGQDSRQLLPIFSAYHTCRAALC